MGTTMNKQAFESLIAENIEWLNSQPRTLEREHIIDICRNAPDIWYGKRDGEGRVTEVWDARQHRFAAVAAPSPSHPKAQEVEPELVECLNYDCFRGQVEDATRPHAYGQNESAWLHCPCCKGETEVTKEEAEAWKKSHPDPTKAQEQPPSPNRFGVDTEYFRKELAGLSASLDNRPAAELSRYLQVLANAAADIHNHGTHPVEGGDNAGAPIPE